MSESRSPSSSLCRSWSALSDWNVRSSWTVAARFSLDYLTDIERPMPAAVNVELRFGSETPLGIAYEFADDAAVEFLVSPRIQTR